MTGGTPGRKGGPFNAVPRSRQDAAFGIVTGGAALAGLLGLVVLLGDVLVDGVPHLSGHFFTSFASRFPERAGIRAPLFGTLWLLGLTAVLALPVSVGAAIYLEELAPRGWPLRLVRALVRMLAGIPSVVYGILGLALVVRAMGLGRSVLAGALTLALIIAPSVILSTQEALRRVPKELRDGAYALGASRWQVVRHQVLPLASHRIAAGAVLALSRAVGETAPLVVVGAVSFIAFVPEGMGDPFTALPVQIYHWVIRGEEFRGLAAAASLVLLALLLALNALALTLQNRFRRQS